MRVILHRVADDVGDLVVTAIFQLIHAVQNAALHGLEAIVNVRHGALQDDVAGVVEEPVAIEIVHRFDLDGRAVREDGGGVFGLGGFLGHGRERGKGRCFLCSGLGPESRAEDRSGGG
jgi:hypothetical protein